MNEFYLFINDYGELVCQKKSNDSVIEFINEEAIKIISLLDNVNFKHISVSSNTIQLSNSRMNVIINDFDNFMHYGYLNHFKNSINRINKAITKYQLKEKNKKSINNLKIAGGSIVVGGLLLTILGNTYQSVKNNDNAVDEANNSDFYESEDLSDNIPIKISFDTITPQDVDTILNEDNNNENNNIAYIDFQSEVGGEKYEHAYNGYHDIVSQYSEKWGVPENVIMAMLTQESGGYVPDNLMQIQFHSWKDQILTEYDFVNNRYQSIVLTTTPEKYNGQNITTITPEELKNKITNISVACVILRYSLERMDYNILASIQAYNLGCNNMNTVLSETSIQTGLSRDELLQDQTNVEFLKNTYIVGCGDPNYIINVARYLDNSNEITIKMIDDEGNISDITIGIAQKVL